MLDEAGRLLLNLCRMVPEVRLCPVCRCVIFSYEQLGTARMKPWQNARHDFHSGMQLTKCDPTTNLTQQARHREPPGFQWGEVPTVEKGHAVDTADPGQSTMWECPCRQGLVLFFPSFSYAEEAMGHWQHSGALAAMRKHKEVFRWQLQQPCLHIELPSLPCVCLDPVDGRNEYRWCAVKTTCKQRRCEHTGTADVK